MRKVLFILFMLLLVNYRINAFEKLKVGDKVKYKNIEFYVISNTEEELKLLKAEPLTYDEVNTYGEVGTDNSHINKYMDPLVSEQNYRKAIDQLGYGGMSYISNENCGYNSDRQFIGEGCTSDYSKSDVKYVVDAWVIDKINSEQLKEGRIPKVSEISNFGYKLYESGTNKYWNKTEDTPSWVYNGNYYYWIIIDNDSDEYWGVFTDSISTSENLKLLYNGVVRPVVVLEKNIDKDIEIVNENENENNNVISEINEVKDGVDVPNTNKNISLILFILGISLIVISVVIIIKNKRIKYMLFIFFVAIIFSKTIHAYANYDIGQIVNLNGMDFYVINNSSSKDDYVTALKKYPLTAAEITQYGEGHINRYTQWNRGSVRTFENNSEYGGMTYYSNIDCGYNGYPPIIVACTNDYNASDIKYTIDNWAKDKFDSQQLKEINNYKARLITVEELNDNLDCKNSICRMSKYSWLNDSYYGINSSTKEFYWTMSGYINMYEVYAYTIPLNTIASDMEIIYNNETGMVRPVINIYKTALGDTGIVDNDDIDDKKNDDVIDLDKLEEKNDVSDNHQETNTNNDNVNNNVVVKDIINNSSDNADSKKDDYIVPNTMKRLSIMGISIGILLITISSIIIIKHKNSIK